VKNALHEITVNSQSLLNLFMLSFDLNHGAWLHHLTPIDVVDEHFLARLMLLFNVQWDIFNKEVP